MCTISKNNIRYYIYIYEGPGPVRSNFRRTLNNYFGDRTTTIPLPRPPPRLVVHFPGKLDPEENVFFFFYQFLTTPAGLCIYIGPLSVGTRARVVCVRSGEERTPQARSDRKLKSQFRVCCGPSPPPPFSPGEQLRGVVADRKKTGDGEYGTRTLLLILFKCRADPRGLYPNPLRARII